jgi:hypothetical protein
MRKIIFTSILFAITLICDAQEFMGIKVDGSPTEVTSAFKAKGFKFVSNEGNIVSLKGEMNGTDIQLFAVFTPKSKKCWKFTIFFPEKSSWESIKSEYDDYLTAVKDKYGAPSNQYETFLSPYYAGDGYEMSAVRLEKCIYASYWLDLGISITISKYKQVRLAYENTINSKIDDKEKNELKKEAL